MAQIRKLKKRAGFVGETRYLGRESATAPLYEGLKKPPTHVNTGRKLCSTVTMFGHFIRLVQRHILCHKLAIVLKSMLPGSGLSKITYLSGR